MFLKRFLKNRLILCGAAHFAVLALSTLGLASTDPENPKPWSEKMLRSLRRGVDHAFTELSTAIFSNLDSINAGLFAFPGNGRGGVELHRDVIDNFDLFNTYTVIDRVRLKASVSPLASLTTWTQDLETPALGTPYVGVIFDPQTHIEWTNVRQVKALEFKRDPLPRPFDSDRSDRPDDSPQAQLIGPRPSPRPLPAPSPDPHLSEINPDVPLTFFDPSIRARFSKLLNLITFPFRLPLHRKDISKMTDGEILAYAFDGQIEVGVKAGLKIIPSLNVLHAGIDLNGSVILHGRYQISVLREDASHARVKLTRVFEKGRKFGIRAGVQRKNVYDGVILFKGSSIEKEGFLKFDLNLIPFNFEESRIRSDQFDVVYRYNLDTPLGREAYHKAVLGRFASSEDAVDRLERDEAENQENLPVEKLLTRNGVRLTRERNQKFDAAGILRLDWNTKRETLDANVELPDGTHHFLEGSREKKHQRRTLFGAKNEKRTQRMALYFDEELLKKRDTNSVFLITEITEEDTNTKADELNEAIDRMEIFLRQPNLLPAIAGLIPSLEEKKRERYAWYGRSSFYYGYSLSLREIETLLRADPLRVALAAQRYFNPKTADRFFEAWQVAAASLGEKMEGSGFFDALQSLFNGRSRKNRSYPIDALTNVIFDSLEGTEIDTFVTAQNVAFGRVQVRGKTITSVEKTLTLTDRELGFETYAQRLKQDSDALVKETHVDKVSGGLSKIRFSLASHPANVFFRLFRVTGYKRQKLVTEVVVNNLDGRFKAGENTLILDPNSVDLLVAKLTRDLHAGEFYNLSIAYSREAEHYGPVSSTRFLIERPYPKRAE